MRHFTAAPLLAKAGLLCLTGTSAPAQDLGAVMSVFKNVNSVTLYAQGAYFKDSPELTAAGSKCRGFGICGMGSEVLITVASSNNAMIELGLGTSFMRGFRASDETLDLRGAVRSFPTFTGYGTWPTLFGFSVAEPYVGLGFGLSDLWNVQAYDTAAIEYGLKGQTFDYGFVGGLYLNLPVVPGLFVEGSYRRRRFASLDWTLPSAAKEKVPDGWPRTLDLSGWGMAIGWQFDVGERKPGPPTLQGTWVLTRLNGGDLPGVLTQGPGERVELTAGFLSFEADSAYTLNTLMRRSTLGLDGKVTAIPEPVAAVTSGRYHPDASHLVPAGEGAGYTLTRSGNEIILTPRATGHQMVFKKAG